MYVLIGALALEVAFGNSGHQADNAGALRLIGKTPAGQIALWLLAAGFLGLTLWQLTEAVWGVSEPGGRKVSRRFYAAGLAALYAVITYSVLRYALGVGAPSSSNKQSQDLTASAMHHPGGRFLVGAAGVALVIAGAVIAVQAWQQRFLRHMRRLATAPPATRRVVEHLGQFGGASRGAIFAGAGVFTVMAAVNASPHQAKGLDATLRSFAATPLGPWLLVLVALGLIVYGLYCGCEVRWRDT
jgi:hypothetical protein